MGKTINRNLPFYFWLLMDTIFWPRYLFSGFVLIRIDQSSFFLYISSSTSSDFDGVDDELPEDLEDVSKYPNLIAELIR